MIKKGFNRARISKSFLKVTEDPVQATDCFSGHMALQKINGPKAGSRIFPETRIRVGL
jgi:hypothetical protein